MSAGTRLVLHVLGYSAGDELLDPPEVLVEQGNHLVGGDMLAGILEPAVVVGGEGDGAVAELCLGGEEGFGNVRHADEVGARTAEKETFSAGPEARALDTGVGLVLVHLRSK